MAAPLGRALAGCALIAFIGISTVRAATDRIFFSGAIVEPTCAGDSAALRSAQYAVAGAPPARLRCGQTATDPGRIYSRQVIQVTAADLDDDRLLAYFATYAGPTDGVAGSVKIIVDTYD